MGGGWVRKHSSVTKLQDLEYVTHASAAVKYYVIKYVLRYRLRVPYLKGLRTDTCFEFHIFLNVWIFEYTKWGDLGMEPKSEHKHLRFIGASQVEPFCRVFSISVLTHQVT